MALYIDVRALIEGGFTAPEPDILTLTEDSFLFYSGEFNLIFGDTESGKTWLCLAAVTDVLDNGGKAAIIDTDHNGAASIINRLQALGIQDDVLVDKKRFRLTETHDSLELKEVVTDLTVFEPEIVVIDSLGEVLPLFRFKSNDADDFTMAHTSLIKPLRACGAAVLVVDHLAKNADSRTYGPTGTAAKSRAVGGTSLRVTVEEPFKPGEGGSAKMELFKDRHGGVRRQFPKSEPKPVIGTFVIDDENGALTYAIKHGSTTPLSSQKDLQAREAEADAARLLELTGGINFKTSVRSIRTILGCGQARAQRAKEAYERGSSRPVPESVPG
jgi:hypothetical protein